MIDSERFFVVCIENTEFPASLERGKTYRRLTDPEAEQDGLIRVIDESGEDYLYPRVSFAPASDLEVGTD